MKIYLFLFFFIFLSSYSSSSQSNNFLDDFLEEKEASFGKAVYLTFVAAGLIDEQASVTEALTVLKGKSWRLVVKESGQPIRLGEFSLLLMKVFEIRGGLMYRLLAVPRYAARELVYLGLISGSTDPTRYITGEEAVKTLGAVINWKEINS